jgi:hypothetical protein
VLEQKRCCWKNCKNLTQVDTTLENSSIGKTWGLSVLGHCELHKLASRIYHDLERKFMKKHNITYMTSLQYNKHKKALDDLRKLAEHKAKTTLEEKCKN